MLIGIDGNEANIHQRVGSNIYAFELIKAIEKADSDNEYQIYLREKQVDDMPLKRTNFVYRVIPPKYLWTQWRLPLDLYLRRPRPNVFFSPGHYAPRFCPAPLVISILDLSFLKFPQSFKPMVLRQLTSWTQYSIRQARHILAISQSTKTDIVDRYHIDPAKITVTYPGASQRFTPEIQDSEVEKIKQKYNIPGKYLFTLGTKQPKKNLSRLVEAFSSISNPNLYLVVAGKTWHQFEHSALSLKQSTNVLELGYIPDADLPALYKGAQAFIFPSLYEGFGIPVAEAMTVGTPVVVSNVSSLPEIVGTAGILVDPLSIESIARGIKLALSLPQQKRLQLVHKGKVRARQFSWAKCAQKTLEVLYAVAV